MVNIWPNSTFETSTDPWIAQAGSDTPTRSTDQAHGGTHSLYCARGTGTATLYSQARLDPELSAADSYDLEVYIWIPSSAAGSNGVRIAGTGTATQTILTDLRDQWALITHTFDWDGTGTALLYAYGTAASSRLYLDDLTVDDGTLPPDPGADPEPAAGSGIGCQVYVRPDGTGDLVRLADGSPTDNPLAPTVLTDLKITWGRETTIDQPAGSTCSFKVLDPYGGTSFIDVLTLGTPIVVTAPTPDDAAGAGGLTGATVYTGRVTALTHQWDDAAQAPVLDISTSDFTADLENTIVGDQPWSAQYLRARFATIAELTSLSDWTIDETLQTVPIARRDVDAQGAMGLLGELASTADGVLWSSTSADGLTSRLHLEDPTLRPGPDDEGFLGVYLSACNVLRDDVTWVQDIQDVMTRVAVTWKETSTEDPQNTQNDRTYTLIDPDREATFGQRGLALSSQLHHESDAIELAQRLLARIGGVNWRLGGLTIDDAANDLTPAGTLTNHVPDPSAEYAGITWTGTPPSTSGGAGVHTGGAKCVFTTANSTAAISVQVPADATMVTASAWYRASSGTRNFQLRLDGAGTTAIDSPTSTATTTYQHQSLTTAVTPGGTLNFYPVSALDVPSLYVDDFGITFNGPGTPAGPDGVPEPVDFSGDSPDTTMFIYNWSGTPGASTSTRNIVGSAALYVDLLTNLLDNRTRNGLAIQLYDLPVWSITGDTLVYLEGGDYTFTQGAWVLDLTVSGDGITHTIADPTWADMGAQTWADMGAQTWADMGGLALADAATLAPILPTNEEP